MIEPWIYDECSPASAFAARRDDAWFAANPTKIWRVRPLLAGESPIIDQLMAGFETSRGYVAVIEHARAKDKRCAAGRGIYPLMLPHPETMKPDQAKQLLHHQAVFMVRWFRKTAVSPAKVARGVQ